MPLNRRHTSYEARAAKLLPAKCYRNAPAIIVIDVEKLFKEERLKHNNRLTVPSMDNRDCRKKANNVKLERSRKWDFHVFPSLM